MLKVAWLHIWNSRYPLRWIVYLRCVVHVYDLLIEDTVKKIRVIVTTAEDIRFVVVMIFKYSQLSELFREEGERMYMNSQNVLILYSDTQFAYVYLMATRVLVN